MSLDASTPTRGRGRPPVYSTKADRDHHRKLYHRIFVRMKRAKLKGMEGKSNLVRPTTIEQMPIVTRCCELLIERHWQRKGAKR